MIIGNGYDLLCKEVNRNFFNLVEVSKMWHICYNIINATTTRL